MLYRAYGNTGHEVSALAMGGMRYEKPDDIDLMAEIPLYLYEQGVTYFDTAPGYCGQKSEVILGQAISEMKKRGGPRFYVSTKTFAASEADVRKELETSLERLGVEQIDFYHVWCIRSWQEFQDRKQQGVIDAFRKMKDEGLVGHLAVSTHMNGEETARMAGEGIFDGLLLGFSAANYAYREEGIRAAAAAGLGVVVMNPLGGGVYWQSPETFSFLKRPGEDDFVAAGLRFVLSYPEITTALVGVRNMDDARAAVAAMEQLDLYSLAELNDLKARARREFNALCTSCEYCSGCPSDIPVARLMDTANYVQFNQQKQVFGRLKYHWGVDDLPSMLDNCTACRQCEEACTQHLPILERFEHLREAWAESVREMKARQREQA